MVWKKMIYQGKDLGDYYLVSDCGDIKNVNTGLIRKLSTTKKGYYCCVISLGSREHKVCVRVHKAVAETFIENPKNKPEVNHKDGDKSHNYASNLEWVTGKENMAHAVSNYLHHPTYGEAHGTTKLTKEKVLWARSVYKPRDKDYGVMALSRKLGIDHSTLHSVLLGKTWCMYIEDIV